MVFHFEVHIMTKEKLTSPLDNVERHVALQFLSSNSINTVYRKQVNKLVSYMVLHIFNTDTQSLSSGEDKP